MPKLYKTYKRKSNKKHQMAKNKTTRRNNKKTPLFDASKVHPASINIIT